MVKKYQIYLAGFILFTQCGCTTLNPELARRSETAFRQHNEVASELLLVVAHFDVASPVYQKLTAAEDSMLEACQALNDLAIRYRNGNSVGPIRKLKVPKTIKGCEHETEKARVLLGELTNDPA